MSPHIDPAEAGETPSGDVLKDLGFGVREPVGSPSSFAEQAKGAQARTRASGSGRHDFLPAANPRLNTACVRCGKPRDAPAHRSHPELERAAFISALDMARKAYDEQDRAYCIANLAVATRLIKGDT